MLFHLNFFKERDVRDRITKGYVGSDLGLYLGLPEKPFGDNWGSLKAGWAQDDIKNHRQV